MKPQLLDRLVLPIAIPAAVLVAIAFILLTLSRVLLAVPKEVAPPVALVVALLILLGSAYVATHPVSGRAAARTLAVLAAALLVGGVIGQIKYNSKTEEAAGAPGGAAASLVNVGAKNTAFSVKEITLASSEVTIHFDNQDTVPHNIAIYKASDAKESLFEGKIITGPSATDYKFTAPPPGQYYFQCDVHPKEMNGTVKVEAAAAAPAGGASGTVNASAKNTAFDTKQLSLPAGKESTIHFNNQENVPHNISIYRASDAKQSLFEGKIISGPAAIDYKVPALQAGQYYFQCDVHPKEMNGTVKVE